MKPFESCVFGCFEVGVGVGGGGGGGGVFDCFEVDMSGGGGVREGGVEDLLTMQPVLILKTCLPLKKWW